MNYLLQRRALVWLVANTLDVCLIAVNWIV